MILFPKIISSNPYYESRIADDLSLLANVYQADKGTANAQDFAWSKDYPQHSCWQYTKTYEKYMSTAKEDQISMLELGVCDKRFPYASVKMWMSYFKQVDFYGVDNFWGHRIEDKKEEIEELNKNGVNFIYADQGSYVDWNELNEAFPSKFDFIIDDGSHWPNHTMISLWKSIGILKSGGYFFMEDIQNPIKARGWYKYDNSLVGEELLETTITGNLYSSFLNDQQNADIKESYELADLVLDPTRTMYLGVFKRK